MEQRCAWTFQKKTRSRLDQIAERRIKHTIQQSGKEIERVAQKINKNAIEELSIQAIRFIRSQKIQTFETKSYSDTKKWQKMIENFITVAFRKTETVPENLLIMRGKNAAFDQQATHFSTIM